MKHRVGKLFLLAGPSAVGKTTVLQEVLKITSGLDQVISATTRQPRPGEKNGVDYIFMSEEEFREHEDAGRFWETNQYAGNYYGTLRSEVFHPLFEGKDLIKIVDVNGARQIRERFPRCVTIFLAPPSLSVLEKRLVDRGSSTEEIQKRLKTAENEMKALEEPGLFDFYVENHYVPNTVEAVECIIAASKFSNLFPGLAKIQKENGEDPSGTKSTP